ncbi:hypothetical protein [Kluyvera ascorbata]
MDKKLLTYKKIQRINSEISSNPLFLSAVKMHCESILTEFRQDKLFYKYIFSNNRFIISTITASVFYNKDEAFLSDVVCECLQTGMVSKNTISSLFILFRVSGRILLKCSESDKRKKSFQITRKGNIDIVKLLNTMVPALRLIHHEGEGNPVYLSAEHMPFFFKEYAKIHRSSLYLVNLVKDSDVFISKDSGHMILVCLYMLAIGEKKQKSVLNAVSKECGVSRTHLRNILIKAEEKNMLSFNNDTGEIVIYESYMTMFMSYMSYYFSFVQFGLEGLKSQANPEQI